MSPVLKFLVEAGPLVVFFIAFQRAGIMTATATFMVATVIAIAVAYWYERRIPMVPLLGCVVIMIFGGLTLWLQDETFIKMKPTIVLGIFAALLLGGLAMGRPLLRLVMGAAIQLEERGWQLLTLRFGLFFLVMAGVNEAVWRTMPTETWVNFKVFGVLPLTLVFAALQTPLMLRHQLPQEESD